MSGVTIRGYDEFESIGSGGFSEVFEARQADLNRRVAVKVIKPAEAGFVDRSAFAKECQSMGSVSNHPNIVTLYTHGFTDEGQPYLAMELYEETLLDRLRRSERLPVDQVIEVGIALAAAIERAHDDGIVHCDIKPQNVFFSEYGEPALGDFGIAALETGPEGRQSVGVTLHYAAPEVLDDAPPSEMSDVYSLGATLYTALAGHQPFRVDGPKESAETIRDRIINDPVPPVTEQPIPQRLADLISQMLAKNPNARPQSAAEIQRTLRRLRGTLRSPDMHDVTVPRSEVEAIKRPVPNLSPELDEPTVARRSRRTSVSPTEDLEPDDAQTRAILSESPESQVSTSGRALIATLLAGAVVLSAVVAFLLVGRSTEEEAGSADPIPDFSTSTTSLATVLGPPATPGEIRFEPPSEAQSSEQTISWMAVERASRYEVLISDQIDFDGGATAFEERDPETTTSTSLTVEVEANQGVCVELRSLDSGGRTSGWSQQVCR